MIAFYELEKMPAAERAKMRAEMVRATNRQRAIELDRRSNG
jgi:hypothetical protein